jgi:phenylacetyl-CoA:acceptor oxidoreductase 26-kDa subunit
MKRLQPHWDARAALNFMLGGAGSGLMAVLGLVAVDSALPVMVSLALIAAGLGAVWLEIGRKLRALHVLFNPRSSWMTRESFAALLLFPLGLGSILVPAALPFAAAAALGFLYCQARILTAAKGIPAWRAPEVVPLIIATGVAEGAGLCLLFTQQELVVALFGLAVLGRAVAWRRYRASVKSAMLEPVGTAAVLLLLLLSFHSSALAPLAGMAALAAGWRLKFALVTRAAFVQGFALPHLPVRGTR